MPVPLLHHVSVAATARSPSSGAIQLTTRSSLAQAARARAWAWAQHSRLVVGVLGSQRQRRYLGWCLHCRHGSILDLCRRHVVCVTSGGPNFSSHNRTSSCTHQTGANRVCYQGGATATRREHTRQRPGRGRSGARAAIGTCTCRAARSRSARTASNGHHTTCELQGHTARLRAPAHADPPQTAPARCASSGRCGGQPFGRARAAPCSPHARPTRTHPFLDDVLAAPAVERFDDAHTARGRRLGRAYCVCR